MQFIFLQRNQSAFLLKILHNDFENNTKKNVLLINKPDTMSFYSNNNNYYFLKNASSFFLNNSINNTFLIRQAKTLNFLAEFRVKKNSFWGDLTLTQSIFLKNLKANFIFFKQISTLSFKNNLLNNRFKQTFLSVTCKQSKKIFFNYSVF